MISSIFERITFDPFKVEIILSHSNELFFKKYICVGWHMWDINNYYTHRCIFEIAALKKQAIRNVVWIQSTILVCI